ncbi:ribonuclease III [Breznakiellaceae bacterium SP9]
MPTNLSNLIKNNGAVAQAVPIDHDRKKALVDFQKTAGLRFKSLELLNLSFLHRSVSNESASKHNNERLEFLGDSILGAVTASILYEQFKDKPEGELAKIKAVVVSEEIIAGLALVLQLDTLLILGHGEEMTGGRTKKAILADALEALIGAYYLDSGYNTVFAFLGPHISKEIERVADNQHYRDYKSLLQELSQRSYRSYPKYRLLKRSGPEHEHYFWMEVTVNAQTFGPGMGRTKKTAEQEAARIAYETLLPLCAQ